ncbi:MAG: hypothetical protein LBB65_04725 [Burkholderiales bacterium]|jgi:hypothetical protein|nr:hypothetical protein [Burkholderiales bacterium]
MRERKMRAGVAILALAVLTACGGNKLSNEPGNPVEDPDSNKPLRGLEAPLFSKGGSSAQGKITVSQSGNRWHLSIAIFGVPPASLYRVAFFDNGNCSSPNAFSAGKLWLPPGTPADIKPDKWISPVHASIAGGIDVVARLPNPEQRNEEVFRKRSVLVFAGNDVQELKPGVANDVVACGVFDTIQTLF